MRLSLLSRTHMRSRLPKKSLSSIASWLVVAPLLSLVAITTSPTSASAVVATNPTPVCSGATCTVTFPYAGDYYSWKVPSGVTAITFDVQGAQKLAQVRAARAAATVKVTKPSLVVKTQVRKLISAKSLSQIVITSKAPARKLTLTNA